MRTLSLPTELWREIIQFASRIDAFIQADFFDSTTRTKRWSTDKNGRRRLLDIEEDRRSQHVARTNNRKSLMLVCKSWSLIATEFLYNTIVMRESKRLRWLRQTIKKRPELTRLIKRILIYEDDRYNKQTISSDCVETDLIPILECCNRLQVLSIQQYVLNGTSQAITNALVKSCPNSLQALNLRVTEMTPFSFTSTMDECTTEAVKSTVSSDSTFDATAMVKFSKLTNLIMRGFCLDLIGHAMAWSLPSLTHLTIDFENCDIDRKTGVSTILGSVGPQLTTLNVDASDINFDFQQILSLCPKLESISFNLAHWRQSSSRGSSSSTLGQYPSLRSVGLHGLQKFLCIESSWDFRTNSVAELHTTNFDLLLDKKHFPNLRTLRVLNPMVVEKIAERLASRSRPVFVSERWKRWVELCEKHEVQIVDCAGEPLGSHYLLL